MQVYIHIYTYVYTIQKVNRCILQDGGQWCKNYEPAKLYIVAAAAAAAAAVHSCTSSPPCINVFMFKKNYLYVYKKRYL